jgi:hypothetical protein
LGDEPCEIGAAIQCLAMSSLMMATEKSAKIMDNNTILTWLMTENLIAFSSCESFKSEATTYYLLVINLTTFFQ